MRSSFSFLGTLFILSIRSFIPVFILYNVCMCGFFWFIRPSSHIKSASVTKICVTHRFDLGYYFYVCHKFTIQHFFIRKRPARRGPVIWKLPMVKLAPFFVHYFDFIKFEIESNVKSQTAVNYWTNLTKSNENKENEITRQMRSSRWTNKRCNYYYDNAEKYF